MTAEDEVRGVIERWVAAVHGGDLAGVIADHADDVVLYDVPGPGDVVRGLDAYRKVWPPFFAWQQSGAVFEIATLTVAAGADVAFAHGLLRCNTPDELARDPDDLLRLTVGLVRRDGRWSVTHEHHSFALRSAQPADATG